MKRFLKSLLYRVGLGRVGEKLYFNVRTLSPRVLIDEIRVRVFRSEQQPVPPGKLIYDVIGCRWAGVYLQSGRLLTGELMKTLRRVDYRPERGDRLLDFGCGCGRLTRHLIAEVEAEIFGSDYNQELVEWCSRHLTAAKFNRNQLAPPLRYPSEYFDLVVARSVFTHLTEEIQIRWLAEMERVIRPGGLFYFSMHGPLQADSLSEDQKLRFNAGELIVTYEDAEGANLCSTYANPEYVRRRLCKGFDMIRYEPGRPIPHLRQDVYVLKRLPVSD